MAKRDLTQDDIGIHVIFVDPTGREHDALITAVHGTKCINLVYVLKDPKQYDNYGRKTSKQYTSVMHSEWQQAHGMYWLFPGEERDISAMPEGSQAYLSKANPVTAE
jgi:hypothetical protein